MMWKVFFVLLAILVCSQGYLSNSEYTTKHQVKCTVVEKYIVPDSFNTGGRGEVALKTDKGFVFKKNILATESEHYVVGSDVTEIFSDYSINVNPIHSFVCNVLTGVVIISSMLLFVIVFAAIC